MSGRTALVTGITGQDGAYLARLLLEKGYRVVGGTRRSAALNRWRLIELGIDDAVELLSLELAEPHSIRKALEECRPDEIYNLAAQSFVGESFRHPHYTADVNAMAVLRMLEAMRDSVPGARFYQASTSEMFGKVRQTPQTEQTPFHPRSPYGVAKQFAHWTAVNHREAYGLYCASGILFNHESPLRGPEYLTRKVTLGLARIAAGMQPSLALGNLDARRDWGHAVDYVEGMWRMLQQPEPDDYVLATGVSTSVRDFVGLAATATGFDLEWAGEGADAQGIDRRTGQTIISIDPAYYRPAEVALLVGDATKARTALGWAPTIDLAGLVEDMVRADVDRIRTGHLAGM